MKNRALSTKEKVMIVFLVIVLIGAVYYLAFYKPLQEELASIDIQSSEIDSEMTIAQGKLEQMTEMQAELDEIFANAQQGSVSQIAPYDNSKVIMNQLDGILSNSCVDYKLTFQDPVFDDTTGVVRRTVSMEFTSSSYENAKQIILAAANSEYRCLVTSVDFRANESETEAEGEGLDLMADSVSASASIVYIESTNLTS